MKRREFDVLVIGAGPAGASAAIEVRRQGLSVAVIDENLAAGGQVYRAQSPALSGSAATNADTGAGARLRTALSSSGAVLFFGRSVWHATPGFDVATVSEAGVERFGADRLILAPGTTEKIIPVPGAELPGVIGLAAATIVIKAHRTVPDGPTVVAGVGPLVYAVAAGLVTAGGRVAVVADLSSPGEWLARLPALARRPDLLWQGLAWLARLRRAGVPVRFRHTVKAVEGEGRVAAVRLAPVDATWRAVEGGAVERFAADSLAMGHGLVPASELARTLGAAHNHRPELGGFVPQIDDNQRSTVRGLFLAGDGTGVAGAAAAAHAGRLAGLAVCLDAETLDKPTFETLARPVRRALRRSARFGKAVSALMATRSGLLAQTTSQTIVCRCEDISRQVIDTAAMRGARDVNQLKASTRCGMGPCQGRLCGEAAAGLIAAQHDMDRAEVGIWTARPPFRPVAMDALLGAFDYDDIPRNPPAPA